jgi:hypothetical protein
VEEGSQGFPLHAEKSKFEQELLATVVLSGMVQKYVLVLREDRQGEHFSGRRW